MTLGLVYIARNSSHGEYIFKVGKRFYTTSAKRMEEPRRSTSVLGEFVEVGSVLVKDCEELEARVHADLVEYRLEADIEFYLCPLSVIVAAFYACEVEFLADDLPDLLKKITEFSDTFIKRQPGFIYRLDPPVVPTPPYKLSPAAPEKIRIWYIAMLNKYVSLKQSELLHREYLDKPEFLSKLSWSAGHDGTQTPRLISVTPFPENIWSQIAVCATRCKNIKSRLAELESVDDSCPENWNDVLPERLKDSPPKSETG